VANKLERFGVIETISHRSHRALNSQVLAPLAKEQRRVLAAVIRVMNQTVTRMAVPDRHLQRRENELRAQMVLHRPADHPSAEHIQDDGEIEKSLLLGWNT